MSSETTNFGLIKPDEDEFYDIQVQNENMDKIDQQLKENADNIASTNEAFNEHLVENIYGVATGTNALIMTNEKVTTYKTGMLVAFKNTTENTGAVTLNINSLGAKSIKKPNGNNLSSGNLKAGGIYQVRYDGANFFLLGEGGEYGTAGAPQVLEGFTVGTDDGLIDGTMPNRGAVTQSLPINGSYTIPAGYHNGSGKVAQNIPTKSTQTYTPGTTNQTIAANQFLSGTQTILGDSNLVAANILSGKSIFGVVGSLQRAYYATGTATSNSTNSSFMYYDGTPVNCYSITVSGLTFKPKVISLSCVYGSNNIQVLYEEAADISNKADMIKIFYYNNNTVSDTSRSYRLDGTAAYVNTTGFRLPMLSGFGNYTFKWHALA